MDHMYLKSKKKISIPLHPFFFVCYTKLEGAGKLFFTHLTELEGLCSQECKSNSTEGMEIRNCVHNLVGRSMSEKGDDMNNLKTECFH